jgi:hypothetical protein
MFPLCELVTHAELARPKSIPDSIMESRRVPRVTRIGSLMLYPLIEREAHEPTDPTFEEPTVVASLSNVSHSGLGLVHEEPLPPGTVFEVDWEQGDDCVAVTLQVVHSREIAPRLYRTGARVVSEQGIPVEASANDAPVRFSSRPPTVRVVERAAISDVEPAAPEPTSAVPVSTSRNIMRIDAPGTWGYEGEGYLPAPPGTLRITSGDPRFATTQRVQGASPCGFDRQVEVCRVGDKLWIYIHSPGKKNGWGIYVDPADFENAMARVREQVSHPTIGTLAA